MFDEVRDLDGRLINTKELVAEYIRGAVTKGEVTLVTGDTLRLSGETWLDLVKWSYSRIDGNPVTPIDQETTHHLLFDAIGTVEGDYALPPPDVIDADVRMIEDEMV